MGVLRTGPEAIDWWVPGLRELNGILLGVWLAVVVVLVIAGMLELWRLRRARDRGDVGPQTYRWRSEHRFRFFGKIAVAGLILVPGFFYLFTFLGVLFGSMVATDSMAWNLTAFLVLALWLTSFGWLVRHVRAGYRLPAEPPVHDEPGELPFFLRLPDEEPRQVRRT